MNKHIYLFTDDVQAYLHCPNIEVLLATYALTVRPDMPLNARSLYLKHICSTSIVLCIMSVGPTPRSACDPNICRIAAHNSITLFL